MYNMATSPSRDDASKPASAVENTVAAHTRGVFRLWEAVRDLETELAASWQNVATDQLCRFRLWAHNLGAQHEATSNKSADHRLRAVPDVRERILELLGEISEDFEDIGDILSGKRPGEVEEEDEANSPEHSGPRSEICELWRMVENTVTSLMKISVLVRKSTARNRFDHAVKVSARANAPPIPTEWDIEHVRHKFPKLQVKPWLIKRLGETGTQRRTFLLYAQGHEQRLAAGSASADGSKSVSSRPTEASTQATTVAAGKFDDCILQRLETYDGDDALSAGSATTYNTEGRDDDGASRLTVVPLSSVFTDGEPAICPYCRGMGLFTREKTWRRHVFHDLMAYSCTFEHCDQGPFGSRAAWTSHERHCHLRSWQCPVCYHAFDTKTHVKRHLAESHPSIEEALTNELILAASSPTEHVPASQCPFCDDYHPGYGIPRPVSSSAFLDASKRSVQPTLVPIALFQKHVSRHMEQLALFAVPSSTDDMDEDEPKSDRDSLSVSGADVMGVEVDEEPFSGHSVTNSFTISKNSTPAESLDSFSMDADSEQRLASNDNEGFMGPSEHEFLGSDRLDDLSSPSQVQKAESRGESFQEAHDLHQARHAHADDEPDIFQTAARIESLSATSADDNNDLPGTLDEGNSAQPSCSTPLEDDSFSAQTFTGRRQLADRRETATQLEATVSRENKDAAGLSEMRHYPPIESIFTKADESFPQDSAHDERAVDFYALPLSSDKSRAPEHERRSTSLSVHTEALATKRSSKHKAAFVVCCADDCNQTFLRKDHLTQHIRNQHSYPGATFSCPVPDCSLSSSSLEGLFLHMSDAATGHRSDQYFEPIKNAYQRPRCSRCGLVKTCKCRNY